MDLESPQHRVLEDGNRREGWEGFLEFSAGHISHKTAHICAMSCPLLTAAPG
jgi:hypothetical protein